MTYVPLVEDPRGSVARLATRYGRPRFGRDVGSVLVLEAVSATRSED
jgi:hypothetical protein